jgi:hypothetical protein
MPNYRRARVPGGTYYFIVNLLVPPLCLLFGVACPMPDEEISLSFSVSLAAASELLFFACAKKR